MINHIELAAQAVLVYESLVANLTIEVVDTLVGSLLGDAHAPKLNKIGLTTIAFNQSIIHAAYLASLYTTLACLARSMPTTYTHKETRVDGSPIQSMSFSLTPSPFLGLLASFFYPMASDGTRLPKIVPWTLIPFALTARALAILISDDGSPNKRGGTTLNTQGFDLGSVMTLLWVLEMEHGLICTLHTKRLKSGRLCYNIYITRASLPRLQALVGPYLDPSMLYKVEL